MAQSRLEEQFAKMREILQNGGVAPSEIAKITAGILKKKEEEPEPRIAIIGECGVGKTSTINAIFNAGLPIDHMKPCTHDAEKKQFITNTGKAITVYDMPGIGESISADIRIIEVYKKIYSKVDVILWVIAAGDRQLTLMQHMLLQIAKTAGPIGLQRLIFAINKADIMYPNNWNTRVNLPSQKQSEYLQGFSETVHARIKEIIPAWDGVVPIYSALNAYNLKELLLSMLQAAPKARAHVLNEHTNLDDSMKHVDPSVRDVAFQLFAENQKEVSRVEYE